MATCVVTLNTNTAALSGALQYEPLPDQFINGEAIDTSIIRATVSGKAYVATLIQGAEYRVISWKFFFSDAVFECPADSTADLKDLIEGYSS